MKTTLAIAAASLVLAGCATDAAVQRQQLSRDQPIAVFTTAKGLEATADCIESGLRPLLGFGQKLSVGNESRTRVAWVTNLGNPFATVRMTPAEAGTKVDYRVRFRGSAQAFTNAVMACR